MFKPYKNFVQTGTDGFFQLTKISKVNFGFVSQGKQV